MIPANRKPTHGRFSFYLISVIKEIKLSSQKMATIVVASFVTIRLIEQNNLEIQLSFKEKRALFC